MPLLPADISHLYAAHARALVAYFARRTYDAETAVDLMAETFAVAVRERARFIGDPDVDGIRWLYGIARNQLLDYFRSGSVERRAVAKLGIERRGLTDDEYERVDELASMGEIRGRVAAELSAMPAGHAELLRLRVVDELDYATIADRLDISEQTARTRVSRSLKALAERLEPYLPTEEATGV